MELIIVLLCFFGPMSYHLAGVTKEQVESDLRSQKIKVESSFDRTVPKDMVIDRTESN